MVSLRMLLFCKSVLTKILFHINSVLTKLLVFYVCALKNVVKICDKPTNALINMIIYVRLVFTNIFQSPL